ncbi:MULTISPECIES: hypothetical protein [Leptospira]|uniref:Uncharacterized protein n=3 Tax=Leptospira kirschneri TaxID=29507 RepID=A0A1T1DHJ1_9LEPT|nr:MULTISPECIES: hypothetical protein [Leptospira]EKO15978.1 hypothetical protein LEP1GSC081_4146 [Leptospira kirschneri str. H1]EKO59741.1 hypothetical protein LEP1GSC082_1333 [Leptospira kirschneri str. H2]EMJ90433.1 hypothetical protein LEP1GSC198_1038 [Leptospira kirschneri str. JB]EMK03624.1 hypothetical protein LEP1GSC166_0920 [Leptospira kirschneri]EMK25481.1 hypothetical protein LEP1GSC008_0807 [Leptospira kirschneri serovar Bulgarica str. Nikolaevo]
MKKFQGLFFIFTILISLFLIEDLSADGCYICTSGSTDLCRDYCRYTGSDTFDNRKKCQDKGCKVGGTASCPTASNYKVCSAQTRISTSERFASNR